MSFRLSLRCEIFQMQIYMIPWWSLESHGGFPFWTPSLLKNPKRCHNNHNTMRTGHKECSAVSFQATSLRVCTHNSLFQHWLSRYVYIYNVCMYMYNVCTYVYIYICMYIRRIYSYILCIFVLFPAKLLCVCVFQLAISRRHASRSCNWAKSFHLASLERRNKIYDL